MAARWEDIERVYHEALDCDPSRRPKYLEEACGNNYELRREVESLLSNAAAGDVLLERSGWDLPDGFGAMRSPQFAPGATVGNYRITDLLGEGGMGVVYKAADKKLGRSVALKVIRRELINDAQALARFEREARTLASLTHAHIAAIHGLDEHEGNRFLVLEFVPGETLAERLSGGPMPFREAIGIAKQVAEALEAAHERRIVHRDLKPANIKLTRDGQVKVLDFGLAKAVRTGGAGDPIASRTVSASLTQAMNIVGTPAYMSPEQASGRNVDTRTDVWAFGCVFFEMLSGVRAFSGATVTQVLAAVLEREPDWSVLPAAVPPDVESLVRRCLRKDPRMRLRDIGDARIELEEILAGGHHRQIASAEVPAASRYSARLKYALPAALGLTAVALGLMLFRGRVEPPRDSIAFTFTAPEGQAFTRWPPVPSPNGQKLAFVAQNAAGKSSIWIRPLHAKAAYQLPQTDDASDAFWSPDGTSLGFIAQGKLKRINLSGGPAQNICNVVTDLGATWGPSGDIVVAPWNRTVLHRVPAAGGSPEPITTLDTSRQENSHRWPYFLPDGRHFLFTARSNVKENTAVYAGSLDSKQTKRLLTAQSNAMYVPPGYLLFARDGALMAQPFDAGKVELSGEPFPIAGNIEQATDSAFGVFAGSTNGTVITYQDAVEKSAQLMWSNRTGTKTDPLGPLGPLVSNPQVSPDGKRAAVVKRDAESGNRDIWLVDTATGASTRFTSNPANDWVPLWSADGASIYFASDRLGASSIFRKTVDGAGEEEVVVSNGKMGVFPTGLSRDGSLLMYHIDDPKRLLDLWINPLHASGKSYPWLATEFIEMEGTFSADGKYVAYSSNESGTMEIYVRPFGKTNKHRISTGGGRFPVFRGTELFFAAPDGMIMAVRIRLTEPFEAESPKSLMRPCSGSATFRGSERFYDVSLDGQRLLLACLTPETRQRSMSVLVNWRPAK